MSVSRDVIAKAYNVPESDVRCSNCVYGKRWINMNHRCYYLCQLWGGQQTVQTVGSEFCSFWRSLLKKGAEET